MPKYDEAFNTIYQECLSDGLGGDIKFVEAFMSFLRRKTKLLSTDQSTKEVTIIARKHAKHLKKIRAQKAKAARESKESPIEEAVPLIEEAVPLQPKPSAMEVEAKQNGAPVTELKDQQMDDDDGSPPPVGNGGTTEKYRWTQTLKEVTMYIQLPKGTKSRQVNVSYTPTNLTVGIQGQAPLIDGKLTNRIHCDNSTWMFEAEDSMVTIELSKVEGMSWWEGVLEGDPTINTRKIVPENSKLDDLDRDTRSTVEKMMFDQRQKQMGKPTSDEMKKQEAIKRFMAMHPEMDFSNAKIS